TTLFRSVGSSCLTSMDEDAPRNVIALSRKSWPYCRISRMRNLLVLVLCGFPVCVLAQSLPAPDAPVAKKVHTEHPINGAVLVDDYAWLRERQNPEVKALLEKENAYADKVLAPLKPMQDTL